MRCRQIRRRRRRTRSFSSIAISRPRHPQAVGAINEEIGKATEWSDKHRDELAALYAEASGVDIAAEKRSVDRAEFTFGPLSDRVLSEQQAVADRFQRVGLIPAPIAVRDIVWPWKSNT